MDLLVDSGNSRLKWAWFQAGALHSGGSCRGGRSLERKDLDAAWGRLPAPTRIWVANVAGPEVASRLTEWSKVKWGLRPRFVASQAQGFGVRNGYRRPECLGVDRWLALIAARHHHSPPACVIDCGTALTLDVIDGEGRHHGGMICPGLRLMVESLVRGTAAIDIDDLLAPTAFLGTDTATAVAQGARQAVLALIERSIAVLQRRWSPLQVILTGGDAPGLAAELPFPVREAPLLVLQGLAVVSQGR